MWQKEPLNVTDCEHFAKVMKNLAHFNLFKSNNLFSFYQRSLKGLTCPVCSSWKGRCNSPAACWVRPRTSDLEAATSTRSTRTSCRTGSDEPGDKQKQRRKVKITLERRNLEKLGERQQENNNSVATTLTIDKKGFETFRRELWVKSSSNYCIVLIRLSKSFTILIL